MLLLLLLRAPTRFRSVLVSRSNNSSAFQLPRAPRKLITFTATSSAQTSQRQRDRSSGRSQPPPPAMDAAVEEAEAAAGAARAAGGGGGLSAGEWGYYGRTPAGRRARGRAEAAAGRALAALEVAGAGSEDALEARVDALLEGVDDELRALERQERGPGAGRPPTAGPAGPSGAPSGGRAAFAHRAHVADVAAAAGLLASPERFKKSVSNENLQKAQHPLRGRLEAIQYPSWLLDAPQARFPGGLADVPFSYVETEAQLGSMVAHLEAAREIAVDLENHAYHSFQGFSCLMQVSTRERDYVVDTIALKGQIGPALAGVFADDSKVKVFHDARGDMEWLQRDFNLYIVNLFDTGVATRVLALQSFGLAFCLDHYCNVKANKRYQLADWRKRPLGQELIDYARTDTHYLLFIYDRLRQELHACRSVPEGLQIAIPKGRPGGALGAVLQHSWQICGNLYRPPVLTETTYLTAYSKAKSSLAAEELAAYAALYNWRFLTAKELDESTGFVLNNANLWKLSKALPTAAKEVKKICGHRSLVTQRYVNELARLILNSKSQASQVAEQSKAFKEQKKGKGASGGPPPAAAAARVPAPPAEAPTPPAASGPGGFSPFPNTSEVRVQKVAAPERPLFAFVAPAAYRMSEREERTCEAIYASFSVQPGVSLAREASTAPGEAGGGAAPDRPANGVQEAGGPAPVPRDALKEEIAAHVRGLKAEAGEQAAPAAPEPTALPKSILEKFGRRKGGKRATGGAGGGPPAPSKKAKARKLKKEMKNPAKIPAQQMSREAFAQSIADMASVGVVGAKRDAPRTGGNKRKLATTTPYVIPEGNLIKAGKRRKQPNSGNRSATFK